MVPQSAPDPIAAAQIVAGIAEKLAAARDSDGAVPDTEVETLAATGLLHAPLPPELGGCGLGMAQGSVLALRDVLRIIGGASLSLGRLYEGHVNAIRLVTRFGSQTQLLLLAGEAAAGRLSAVWNAQGADALRCVGDVLVGGKIYTSGIGIVQRPLLTARHGDALLMLLPDVSAARGDLSGWTPRGMRASMTGAADFTGIGFGPHEIVGGPGDYYRSPQFAGGAWRVLAVQLGGLEQLMVQYREHLLARERSGDAVQRARFGEAAVQLETARLWTARAALAAEDPAMVAADVDALVNLARHGFGMAAQAIIDRANRGIGLQAMLRPHPAERIVRDLDTYLRQPFPDAALDAAAHWALQPRAAHVDIGGPC